MRDQLAEISRVRAKQGFTPSEIAAYVLSLKKPIFVRMRAEITDPQELADESWSVGDLIDRLGLFTTEIFQKSREEVIARQQQEMLELSTPVVKLWDGILALPLIGTLDSARTQIVMESLLQRIVETGIGSRDHRHHRRAHGRYAGGAASAQDRDRGPADGRGLHHQRHPSADRADHRAPGRGSRGRGHQGHAGRRIPSGAGTHRLRRHAGPKARKNGKRS